MSTKREELNDPNSCINRSLEDEPVFVLAARDPVAPYAIKAWADMREMTGAGRTPTKEKVLQAREVATQMQDWRDKNSNRAAKQTSYSESYIEATREDIIAARRAVTRLNKMLEADREGISELLLCQGAAKLEVTKTSCYVDDVCEAFEDGDREYVDLTAFNILNGLFGLRKGSGLIRAEIGTTRRVIYRFALRSDLE